MPPVPKADRRIRAALLRETGERNAASFLAAQVGATVSVLTEAEQSGHTEHFAPVRLTQATASGQLIAARVTGITAGTLLAEAA